MIFKKLIFIITFTSIIHSAHKSLPYPVSDLANPMSTEAILAGEMKFMAEPKAASEAFQHTTIKNIVHPASYLAQALKDHLPIRDIQDIIAQYLLNRNDLSKCIATFNSHSKFRSLIQLNDGRLAFGSEDNTIKIWDSSIDGPDKCVATLNGHNHFVLAITQLKDGKLVSGSCDKTIKIWDLNTNKCIGTLAGHNKVIYSIIQLKDGRLASGSWDSTIKIWDLNSTSDDKCVATLEGHNDLVHSIIQLKDGKLASCSSDGTIKIWDLQIARPNQCIATLNNHDDPVMSIMQLLDGRLISCSYKNKSIEIWDLDTRTCVTTLYGHTRFVSFANSIIQLQDGKLATCSKDKTIRIWDLDTNTCIATLEGHKKLVYSIIQLQDGRIVSCSADKTVKIWGNPCHELIQPYCEKPDNKEKDNKQKFESSCTIL